MKEVSEKVKDLFYLSEDEKKSFFKEGLKFELRHDKIYNPLICTVNNFYLDSDELILTILDNPLQNNICAGEFVTCYFYAEQYVYSLFGEITNLINTNTHKLKLKIVKLRKFKSIRKSKRFIYISNIIINTKNSKNIDGIVNNISEGGFSITSKERFQRNDIISLTLPKSKYIENEISLKSKVVRVKISILYFDYGLELFEISTSDKKSLGKLINKLESTQ